MTRIVSRASLADLQGVSPPTVDTWVRQGCPVVARGGRGKEWKFDNSEVTTWRIERKVAEATGAERADEEELRRRKLAAETELAELELAKARGDVVGVAQIERNLSVLFAEVRTNVRNIPDRVVSSLIGMTDEREFKDGLRREIDLVLEALSDSNVLIESSEDDAEDDSGGGV